MWHARNSEGEMIMANDALQTFIGPRILIKFAGAWEQAQAYEYMTAVYDTAYQSWVSKCDVPANTPLVEGDYWMKWSDPNAQFHLLQQTVQTFDQRISNNASEIQQNKNSISDTNNSVYALDSKLDKTQNQNGLAIAFGDSITNGYSLRNPETQAWPAIVSSFFNNDFYNFATDGANFSGGTITAQVSNAASDSRFENADVTMVLVSGGINDHGQSQSNITTGLDACFNAIKTKFPNANIYFAIGLNAATPLDSINQGDNQYAHSRAINVIVNWAKTQSGIFCFTSAYKWLTGMSQWANDAVHPNELGATVIAINIINSIRGANSENKLIVHDLAINGDIKTNSGSYFYAAENGDSGYFTMKINLSESPTSSNTIMTLPIAFNGRQNQITIVPFYSAVNTKLAYLNNGVLKPWQSNWTINTDYYCRETISVGM